MTRTYLGLDIGTSSVKALLIDADQKVVAEASPQLTVSRPHPLWSEQDPDDWVEGSRPAWRRSAPRPRRPSRNSPGSGSPGRCTARPCSTRPTGRSARRSCGTTGARSPNAPSSSAAFPTVEKITGNLAMPGFTAPKMLWVAAHEPEIARRRSGAAAQGLRAPAPHRRGRFGNVRRVRNVVARRGKAPLGRAPAGGDRPHARRDAAARRGLGGLGPSLARRRKGLGPRGSGFRSPAGAATMRPPPSASARPRRARASSRSAPRA